MNARTCVRTLIMPAARKASTEGHTTYLYVPPADSPLSLDALVEELIRQHPGIKSTRTAEGILVDWT